MHRECPGDTLPTAGQGSRHPHTGGMDQCTHLILYDVCAVLTPTSPLQDLHCILLPGLLVRGCTHHAIAALPQGLAQCEHLLHAALAVLHGPLLQVHGLRDQGSHRGAQQLGDAVCNGAADSLLQGVGAGCCCVAGSSRDGAAAAGGQGRIHGIETGSPAGWPMGHGRAHGWDRHRGGRCEARGTPHHPACGRQHPGCWIPLCLRVGCKHVRVRGLLLTGRAVAITDCMMACCEACTRCIDSHLDRLMLRPCCSSERYTRRP